MSVAESFVSVRPDMQGFGGELRRGLGGLTSIAKAGGLAIGAALVGAGVAIVGVGREFEDAFNTIRLGTGATGDALEDLKDDFRAVASRVPADFGDVSNAVADLNTRLGLTGPELQAVSTEFLDLARITGGEVSEQIRLGTRVFGDWGIEANAASETMDKFWRAAQESGASVDDLMTQVVQFGGPLRGMGFGLEESIALFADFEREGVNAELVIGALRQGLGRMAAAGEEAPETFRRIVEEIEGMESRTEATALAMELFGARAGPDMAAAIQEGRFSVEEMLGVIEGGEDTIRGAAEDTRTLTESWTLFKNNAMLALEPIAERVLGALSDAFERLAEWWQENGPVVEERVEAVGVKFGEFTDAVRDNWPTIESIFESLREIVSDVASIFGSEMGNMASDTGEATGSMEDSVEGLARGLDTFLSGTQRVTGAVSSSWNLLTGAMMADTGRFQQGLDDLTGGGYSRFVTGTLATARAVTDAWLRFIDSAVQWFRELPGRIIAAIGDLSGLLTGAGRQVIGGFTDGLTQRWESTKGWLSSRAAEIRNLKGPIDYDRTILEGAGHAVIEGFGRGMEDEWRQIERKLGMFTAELPSFMVAPQFTASMAGVDGVPIHVTTNIALDGYQIGQSESVHRGMRGANIKRDRLTGGSF